MKKTVHVAEPTPAYRARELCVGGWTAPQAAWTAVYTAGVFSFGVVIGPGPGRELSEWLREASKIEVNK